MITMKSLSIEGSYVGSLQDMHDLMAIARSGVLPDMPLMIESLDKSSMVLENLRQGNIRGRCILKN
jgi:D-arabinose 1-dehydrogenase-like Zn-dependent alcohol dehydrogenase